ncbi:MAG: acyltransferase 3 [Frankiales bacterium]|nr:acyltransferase 3 [Frankiales bacterium]
MSPTTVQALRPIASALPRRVHAPQRRGRFALLGHSPALDGLRGLALLLVLAYHFVGHDVLFGATNGVDVFFGLSGFLITALILDEIRVHGRLSLGRFYLRRACRLLPALFVFLAVWCVLLAFFHDSTWFAATPSGDGTGRTVDVAGALRDIGMALVYFANWNVISGGMEAPLSHLWSLAVEEQFYILWPTMLLGLLFLGKRMRLVALGTLIAISAALPWLFWDGTNDGQDRIYFGTDTRAVGLLMGAFCALVWHERKALERVARFGLWRALAGLALVLVVATRRGDAELKFTLMPFVLALAVSQLVPYLAENRGWLSRVFRVRWLVWVGKRSYGLYLWHYVWATWTHPLDPWVGVPLGVLGTFVCTIVSWRLVEQPALAFGRRFTPQAKQRRASSSLTYELPARTSLAS